MFFYTISMISYVFFHSSCTPFGPKISHGRRSWVRSGTHRTISGLSQNLKLGIYNTIAKRVQNWRRILRGGGGKMTKMHLGAVFGC